jgi:hypothetical protein
LENTLNPELFNHGELIVSKVVDDLLFIDKSIQEEKLLNKQRLQLAKYNNPKFWQEELKPNPKRRFKERKRFEDLKRRLGCENYNGLLMAKVKEKSGILSNN